MVRYYYQVQATVSGAGVLQPVPARSPQALEFTFGQPYEVHRLNRGTQETAHPVALIGAQTFRRVDLLMQGRVDALTVVFQPGGFSALFRLPADVLTNDHFDATALGPMIAALHHQLAGARTFADRVAVADAWLLRRGVATGAGRMAAVAGEVLRRSGAVSTAALAQAAGISVRQLERRFVRDIGITPKLYATITRFESALRRKAAEPARTWTEIAHALGYHDQMHMVHDFTRLSGDSPSRISARLDMFVQPEVETNG